MVQGRICEISEAQTEEDMLIYACYIAELHLLHNVSGLDLVDKIKETKIQTLRASLVSQIVSLFQ
jgi:hypothetical protein